MRTLPPTLQPRSCSPCANAEIWASAFGSSALPLMSTPMRRTLVAACCARAASGHAAEQRNKFSPFHLIELHFGSLPARAGLQHIELARISQEVTEAPPGPDQIFSAASLLTYQQ